MGYSPRGCKELDTTEVAQHSTHTEQRKWKRQVPCERTGGKDCFCSSLIPQVDQLWPMGLIWGQGLFPMAVELRMVGRGAVGSQGKGKSTWQATCGLQRLRYLLSGPLQKIFANNCSRPHHISNTMTLLFFVQTVCALLFSPHLNSKYFKTKTQFLVSLKTPRLKTGD